MNVLFLLTICFLIQFCTCMPTNETSGIVLDDDEEEGDFPVPPVGENSEDTRAVVGFVNYDNVISKISWRSDIMGKGRAAFLQLPANRLPSKFKANHKYYLAFGNPDYSYGGCSNGLPCRFIEHCTTASRFYNSFKTFADNSCLIGNDFIGVCCGTSSSPVVASTTSKTTITRTTTAPSIELKFQTTRRPAQSITDKRCGNLTRFIPRVIGGEKANKDDWPWMAALLDREDNQLFCGGVLITNRHVLSAAHCFITRNEPSEITVRLGEYDFTAKSSEEKDFAVSRIKVHERYSRFSHANDIALLTLSAKVTFTNSIQHICLPDRNMVVEERNSFVTGFGRTCFQRCDTSSVLLELYLPTWKQSDCVRTFAESRITVPETQLCAGFREGGKDSCQGDSGGPLMTYFENDEGKQQWAVIGIVSRGIGCGKPGTPGIYTRVTSYIDWIQTNVRS